VNDLAGYVTGLGGGEERDRPCDIRRVAGTAVLRLALIERSVGELLGHEDDLLDALTATQQRELADLLKILLASLSSR
jgi:hypothetical protein